MMSATQDVAREEKHVVILKKLDSLLIAVNELESLASRIDPIPEKAGLATPPVPTPTLARFLDSMPSELMALTDRINGASNRIRSSVL